ncbi:hypothetical protein AWC38_SpisGene20899 [Stylophora pistillata]|uniref:Transient receptor potential cation channel subfamily V member 4 n=1 Tax=Stylophora pistillata TaxID=50429 RepID=A0A2B4RF61_STYPI|nr:hypothetical protein AWC38_SpisGene20899 [Stylophora pistillata]
MLLVVNMKKEDYLLVEFSDKEENKYELQPEVDEQQDTGLFEDELNTELWTKIHQKQREGTSWNKAIDEVRVEKLIQKYKNDGELDSEDPALLMLKQWPKSEWYKNNPDKLRGLERLINRLLDILLDSELNYKNRYQRIRDKGDKTKKTLMHYAAELGFLDVTKTLAKKCPWLLTVATKAPLNNIGLMPVEIALEAENDDVTAYLIRLMYHERAQSLFSWIPGQDMTNPQPSFFSFKSIIENPRMKKTVVANLDQMVNPQWPHLPKRKETYGSEEEREGIEGAWNSITDDPWDYCFCYHILDGDEGGRPPKIGISAGKKERDNPHFNWGNNSCLEVIAKSKNKEALQHPVVRMLVKRKWRSYGHFFLSFQAALYVIFLLFLSYSLLHASTRLDPTQTTGLYTKTLAKIIQQDLARFMAVFSVIFLPFCSALFLSLRSSSQISDNTGFSGFESVLLSGFRALSEQRPIAEDYSIFNWLSILLMLAYMGTVIVILLNILIAQMSTTYIQAKKVAHLEYDVDRILHLTRMERFPLLNLRVKYYKEEDWISEKKLAEELLEFSEDGNPWESVEDKLNVIRDMMKKMVKQMKQGRE